MILKNKKGKNMETIRTENWCGHNIRFVEINGEWWAILKDICDTLNLKTFKIAQRLEPCMLERVKIDVSDIPSRDARYEHRPVKSVNKNMIKKDIGRRPGDNKTRWMLAVNELGIYEALFASRRLEARKFRIWAGTVMQKLRKNVGLEGYEVMRMTEKDIQDDIDHILDTLFWDDEKKCVMQSVTVQGGDVDQVPFMK
jgi:prophage antirepressor-like protein